MNVRELFRNKLEFSEVTPGELVKIELMHKLVKREFLHFIPSKFNIYYMGGILAAGLITFIILTSGPDSSEKPAARTPGGNYLLTDSVITEVLKMQPSGEKAINGEEKEGEYVDNKPVKVQDNHVVMKPAEESASENRQNISLPDISDSLIKKTMIREAISDRNDRQTLQMTIKAAFEVSSVAGCTPLKVKFMNRSTSYDSCQWVFGDGGFCSEKNPEWIFDVPGDYKVLLKVFNSNDAEAVASSIITVHPKPVARFELSPEKAIIPDDEIHFLNYSMDAVRYIWEFGDGNSSSAFEPDHKYNKFADYNVRLIVWSEYGCSDSMIVTDAFSGSGCYIDFPNAFIPNPDGPAGGYYSNKSDETAQIFHPVSSGVSDYHLKIFSKLGILIFESNDISIGWDGYLRGQLCEPGVYIWKVRGTYRNGESFVKMGDVTLLKK